MCCLMAPCLSKDIRCLVWPYYFQHLQISKSDMRPWGLSMYTLVPPCVEGHHCDSLRHMSISASWHRMSSPLQYYVQYSTTSAELQYVHKYLNLPYQKQQYICIKKEFSEIKSAEMNTTMVLCPVQYCSNTEDYSTYWFMHNIKVLQFSVSKTQVRFHELNEASKIYWYR